MTEGDRTEAVFETLLEHLPVGVIVEGPEGKFRHVNGAVTETIPLGMSPEELVGLDRDRASARLAAEFEDTDRFLERTGRLADARETSDGERFDLVDGRTVSRSYVPVSFPTGSGNIWLYRDVTEQAAVEYRLRALHDMARELFFAETREEVARIALETIRESFSMQLAALWEYVPAEEELQPVAETDASRELLSEIPSFEKGEGLAWDAFDDGEIRYYNDLSAADTYNPETPIRSEILVPLGEQGLLIAGSTQCDQFDGTDVEVFGILSQLVAGALTLVDERGNLELLGQIFARILRHNLRNDLTVIDGLAEKIVIADDGELGNLGERIRETVTKLERTVERAGSVQTVVENPGECGTVDVCEFVRRSVGWVRQRYPEATIDVELPDEQRLVRAHVAVGAALQNVIENGVEHNDGPEPTVSVTVETGEDSDCVVVTDDGPGIPDGEVTVLEEGEETQLQHGSGAGLWLAERVTHHSGGSITFDTGEWGTTVRLCLPRTE